MSAVGMVMNTISLMEHLIGFVRLAKFDGPPYGGVGCVFDWDSFPVSNFARVFELARASRLHVAWSNEAVEEEPRP
jgi:hypothetical protein